MSDWKRAFGWSGHILVSADDMDSDPYDNVMAISGDRFDRLMEDYNNENLDESIGVRRLGVTESDTMILAIGGAGTFSDGFKHYGTVFIEAELRSEKEPLAMDYDKEYLASMKKVYGLELPPCRLMIGCSSEH